MCLSAKDTAYIRSMEQALGLPVQGIYDFVDNLFEREFALETELLHDWSWIYQKMDAEVPASTVAAELRNALNSALDSEFELLFPAAGFEYEDEDEGEDETEESVFFHQRVAVPVRIPAVVGRMFDGRLAHSES